VSTDRGAPRTIATLGARRDERRAGTASTPGNATRPLEHVTRQAVPTAPVPPAAAAAALAPSYRAVTVRDGRKADRHRRGNARRTAGETTYGMSRRDATGDVAAGTSPLAIHPPIRNHDGALDRRALAYGEEERPADRVFVVPVERGFPPRGR
jgi:hypothetical protein